MSTDKQTMDRKKLAPIEYVGLVMVALSIVVLLFFQEGFSGIYNAMFNRAFQIFGFYLFDRNLGAAIVVSVMTGRILERLGFTDALMRLFVPLMKYIKVNSTIVVGVIYNILGDVNASGRIAAPVVMKAGCTKDEQRIAIATLCQAPCSFSIIVFGIMALTYAKVSVFPVIIVGLILPIFVVPLFLRLFWRDTKAVDISELPRFTPTTSPMDTIFGAAREGAQLVFLFIIPAGVVIFSIIGALEHFGIWQPISGILNSFLGAVGIEPESGVLTIITSNTLAMSSLAQTLQEGTQIMPRLVVGSFVLANSAFPIQVPFGQIPAVWSPILDLSESECMVAAVVGCIIRLVYAILCAFLLTPLVS
ncbi:MAG: hypothetical protein AAGU12_08075 [Clostridiales bacterium]